MFSNIFIEMIFLEEGSCHRNGNVTGFTIKNPFIYMIIVYCNAAKWRGGRYVKRICVMTRQVC